MFEQIYCFKTLKSSNLYKQIHLSSNFWNPDYRNKTNLPIYVTEGDRGQRIFNVIYWFTRL